MRTNNCNTYPLPRFAPVSRVVWINRPLDIRIIEIIVRGSLVLVEAQFITELCVLLAIRLFENHY